ncbi:molecular chaperone GrpE [Porphyromonas macacae]|uniref:nucleotide exchange factor GrpE n=1 Tax=Porphyromonas macacae TaxID=28115 RepID=UPI00052B6391|nr:nucleotide exchange factor GrpE [Porphyromonas macacae]KGO00572.1 molecular chaperone GrpE [Porphyromonas macacae]
MKTKKEDLSQFEEEEKIADNLSGQQNEPTEAEAATEKETEDNCSDEEKLERELETLKDEHLRLRAEFENYRKRTLKEKSELIRNGGEKSMLELLPVIDDIEIAIKNITEATDVEALKEGILLIHSKFLDYLKKQGVTQIETDRVPFDENFCEAIAVIPAQKEEDKGVILDCIKKGYMLNDKVIRHANVVVGQ